MAAAVDCLAQNVGRRRLFWTTRADVCGSYDQCGRTCTIPGLEYQDDGAGGRTIATDNFLQGLILNILNTRARSDLKCPAPSAVYGHWSESYRNDGLYVGSRLWNAAERPYIRTADSVKAIQAAVQADMAKLTITGVADSVLVEASYVGRNQVAIIVTATKGDAHHSLNLAGSFVSGGWVWN